MKRAHYWLGVLLAGSAVLTAGCGGKSGADGKKAFAEHGKEDGHGHEEAGHGTGEKSGVAFREGRGLQLSPEIVKALGLTTVDAAERPLAAEMKLLAQVFSTKPEVLASASVSEAEAERLEKQTFRGARLVRIDRTALKATRRAEAIFAIDRTPAPQLHEFISLVLASEPTTAIAVPRSAVLDGATGTFVYVVNGEFYLRTAVKLGVSAGDYVEVTDGLYAGDAVVVSPVDQLWLSELRLTKGGGHSH
ncbi:MAG: efflux RND transporter periplasmic adaptor subunit [Opitutaceae bacterium]